MSVFDDDFFTKAKEEIVTNVEVPLHLTSLFLKLKSLKHDHERYVGFVVFALDKSTGLFGNQGIPSFLHGFVATITSVE